MPELLDGALGGGAGAIRREIRTPRAAGVAGLVFSGLVLVALVLIREAVGAKPSDGGAWLTDETHRKSAQVALGLLPFAAIAFLWFIGVVRDYIGDREDRFFASVFLGSGLLFLAMMLAAAALAAGLIASGQQHNGSPLVDSGVWGIAQRATHAMIDDSMRLAAVFMVSASTILQRGGTAPRWLTLSGYLIAAVLLIVVGWVPWVEVLFPVWVMLVSLHILRAGYRRSPPAGAG
jgi:hypothetical protein